MPNITVRIIQVLESDPSISIKNVNLVLASKGLFKPRRVLSVYGVGRSAAEKEKIIEIVKTEAGIDYEVVDRMLVI